MVARGPGPHRGLGKPEREDPARVEEPAPGVHIHISTISDISTNISSDNINFLGCLHNLLYINYLIFINYIIFINYLRFLNYLINLFLP